ncbi:MAG: hypothetical protein M5U14_21475 [Acidimicrobiia bacterium]|nr:hypothetical protein [Acidimicrobiia bacterium]
MLGITSSAANALTTAREQRGLPDHFGVRVFAAGADDTAGSVKISFEEAPASGDAVSETEGVRLFVDESVAEALSDLVIDAAEVEPGEGRQLVLRKA